MRCVLRNYVFLLSSFHHHFICTPIVLSALAALCRSLHVLPSSWIHIDGMHALLQMHYDNVHFEQWKDGRCNARKRKSEWRVLGSTVNAHRKPLCQTFTLPNSVRDVLRTPADESNLAKLEQLREAILQELEGPDSIWIESPEHAESIARALEMCPRPLFVDELGEDCGDLPAGCRIVLDSKVDSKAEAAAMIRNLRPNQSLDVLMRPFDTERTPLLDAFGKKLRGKSIAWFMGKDWKLPEILDRMLLCLYDAVLLAHSDHWSRTGVANLKVDETPEIARWFNDGIRVGSKPIFDGICSMCAALLYGDVDGHSASSNKSCGAPLDRDGAPISNVHAQPPFLLRYSPGLFAKEASAMFNHDVDTNRLSLVEGMHAPWRRKEHARANLEKPWLYCVDCKNTYFPSSKRQRGHIPFRDKASQCQMKKPHEREAAEGLISEDLSSQVDEYNCPEEREIDPFEDTAIALPSTWENVCCFPTSLLYFGNQ